MSRFMDFLAANPWASGIVALCWGFAIVCWWRWVFRQIDPPASRPAPKAPKKDGIVFVEEPRKRYASYEEFRRDLLSEEVSVEEVFARCDGVVPPRRSPQPQAEPKVERSGRIPGTAYVVGRNAVTGLWDVAVVGPLGTKALVSSHLKHEDALEKAARYYRVS